jgi:hypothetical protein
MILFPHSPRVSELIAVSQSGCALLLSNLIFLLESLGFWTLSIVRNYKYTGKRNVSVSESGEGMETITLLGPWERSNLNLWTVFRRGKGDTCSVGPLEGANLNHWSRLGLFFDSEYGDDMFLRNICWLATDYLVL